MAAVTAAIPGYAAMGPMQKVRALRIFVYRNTPLAAEASPYSKERVESEPLREIFASFTVKPGGFWCGETAILLSRVYKAAGFRSFLYDFGRDGMLTHITTLVEVEGADYLQDAYLDFEQVDAKGRPIPFMTALNQIRQLSVPVDRELSIEKVGFFPDQATAATWFGATPPPGACQTTNDVVRCVGPITLRRFLNIFFLMPQTYQFLSSQGWPQQVDFLMMYPRRVFTLYPSDRSAADEMFKSIAHLSSRGPVQPHPSSLWNLMLQVGLLIALLTAGVTWRLRENTRGAVLPFFVIEPTR